MEETNTLQEEYSPTDAKREKVRRVAVAMIDDFPEHPFKVKDDEEMEKLKDSISLYGVLTPVVAFFPDDGASMMVASTMLPPCTIFPSDERISCTSAKSRSGIPCAFSSAGICRA